MSTLLVKVVQIDNISPHPNAERLELATIGGWNCVVRKSEFTEGQAVVYIPIDAVLPHDLEMKLFPPESKVRLHHSRVKSIKLRGVVSQGLVITLAEAGLDPDVTKIGDDVCEHLGITKYDPPEPGFQSALGKSRMRKCNPEFRKYTDIENIKNYNHVFEEGEWVSITEKIHGTSARFAVLPVECKTLWQKFLRWGGWIPRYEFCCGSRNVQVQPGDGVSVYTRIAEQYRFAEILEPGTAVYGEIVGYGIQKGYSYGCLPGEIKFFAYDVMKNGEWLSPAEFECWCDLRCIPRVPVLHYGPYSYDHAKSLTIGHSYIGGQKIREGVVIKPIDESVSTCGRKVLKFVSDEFLLGDNTEYK